MAKTTATAFELVHMGALLALAAGTGCAGRTPAQASGAQAAPASRDPAAVKVAGDKLDALIDESWRAAGVIPAPPAGDGEYLRRVTLDLVGRVPTLNEATTFLADNGPDKRARLVDRLLASPGFGEHWADLTETLLFGGEPDRKIERDDPRAFFVTAFNENWRYDRITTDILTATGTLRDNPAGAFLVAREKGGGGPEAAAGSVARIFLGLQIQCAQCHDHPYDKRWKQTDFYGLVGYFARTKTRREKGDAKAKSAAAMPEATSGMMNVGMMTMGPTYELFDQNRGEAKMHAPGATKDVVIKPKFLGRSLPEPAGEPRRQTLARAVVGSDLFAKAMVARTWAQLFGAGLMDPWDDLGAEGDAKHPPLLVALADDFRHSGFDIKALLRQLVLSTAYARSSAPPAAGQDDGGAAVRAFARARVRPLAPEQLFRSLLVATGADEIVRDRQRRRDRSDRDGEGPGDPADDEDKAQRLIERTLREYRFTFDDDEMADADFDGTLPQALLLLNGEFTNNSTRAEQAGVLGTILAETRDPAARIERLFLAAYTRRPTPDELSLFRASIKPGGAARKSYEDAFFALLTSTEAVTNH
jgi:hypothetical protein